MAQKSEPLLVEKTTFHTFSERLIQLVHTLCCIALGRCCLGLETRVITEISTYPCCPINNDWFSLGWSKKIQNGRLKKTEIFNSPNSQCFFAKISEIGPWVNTINWCEGQKQNNGIKLWTTMYITYLRTYWIKENYENLGKCSSDFHPIVKRSTYLGDFSCGMKVQFCFF